MNNPSFIYGTAWKEDQTELLVREALAAGFRAFDTANQRKHYYEAGVGAAIRGVPRDELFLQTKYTYVDGQDHRLPYDPQAGFTTQVNQSFASSLEHLGVDRIDSYVLHGPRTRSGLTAADREVWRAMEELQRRGLTRFIGASNVTAQQVALLCEFAEVKPAFVQNRCYAQLGWDREVREVCRREGVIYQGFSLLTANVRELRMETMRSIAARHRTNVATLVFAFAMHAGMIPLTGTTDPQHMREDLAALDLKLDEEEVTAIEGISG
ncbi:MAG TPA: aldo/keto reductase [Thermoanaerobaculia bacterium]|nr:aldo/keto reductase [Thermoanaerobaculia bacterium]